MGFIKMLNIHQEAEDITAKNGDYLHPRRLTLMTKAADRVTKTLVGLGNEITYTEMLIVLKVVTDHINEALQVRRERGIE